MQGYVNNHDAEDYDDDDNDARIPDRSPLPVLADLKKYRYEWMFCWRMTNAMGIQAMGLCFHRFLNS